MSAPASRLPSSLVLVGAGKMGGSMLEGWLKVGMKPEGVTVLDPRPSESMVQFCRERGIDYHETSMVGSYREILGYLHAVSAPLRARVQPDQSLS